MPKSRSANGWNATAVRKQLRELQKADKAGYGRALAEQFMAQAVERPIPMEEVAAQLRILRLYAMVLDANALVLEVNPTRAGEVARELRELADGLREMVQ